jgi:DNA repair exonuclease SbcCD ATPase subunit
VATAPVAPGSIGSAIEPTEIKAYLDALDDWLRARRAELDELDAAALAANRGGQVAGDMMLSMALWKAVSDRYQLIFATWDGGRVLQSERERISSLIWGRLDGASDLPGGMAVSVPEACRLSDALAAQLRTALSLVPGADASAARIKQLRAQLERLRDQVALEPANARPAAAERVAELAGRLAEMADKAQRGGDVAGMLAPLENDATTCERDLIVGNAQRRDARDQLVSARELRADLAAREAALERLAEQCVRTVDPAPRYAVPDVDALGPVPNTPDKISAYLQRLERVSEALNLAQHKYADALAEHTELVDLLDAYVAKAKALGAADRPDLTTSEKQAREVLARRPAPMTVCRQLVATYQTWLTKESA